MKYKIWIFSILLLFLYSGPVSYTSDEIHKIPIFEPIPDIQDPLPVLVVSAASTTETNLNPALKTVCSCESTGRKDKEPVQFKPDGSLLRGVLHHEDVGECQINSAVHEKKATSLGYDLTTKEGNIGYANWLYTEQGLKPWIASKACWQ